MGLVEDLKYAMLGKQAEEKAKMQSAFVQGHDTGVEAAIAAVQAQQAPAAQRGLARGAAEQAYMDTVAPQGDRAAMPTRPLTDADLAKPFTVGGRQFLPSTSSGLAAPQN